VSIRSALVAFKGLCLQRVLRTLVGWTHSLICCHACADTSGADSEVHKLSVILTTLIGFATYKVALVAATLAPDEVEPATQKPVEKA
jgi:hypothetical protein